MYPLHKELEILIKSLKIRFLMTCEKEYREQFVRFKSVDTNLNDTSERGRF